MLSHAKILVLPLLLAVMAATPPAGPAFLPLPANARVLLKGTWQATDDKNVTLIITDKQYIEKYKGSADEVSSLTVLDRPCDARPTARPDGGLYLKTTSADPEDEPFCYAVYEVSATRLAMSMVGGRGNTLVFKRVLPKGGQK